MARSVLEANSRVSICNENAGKVNYCSETLEDLCYRHITLDAF